MITKKILQLQFSILLWTQLTGVTCRPHHVGGYNLNRRSKAEAMEKLQEVFGLPESSQRHHHHEVLPQYMMDLYNTIADPGGVTRARNPYNAKVVRSFVEKDASNGEHFIFNISGLEPTETILEAQFHVHRIHPNHKAHSYNGYKDYYYSINVYQVLDEKYLEYPYFNRLLDVHYATTYTAGWEVFDVKDAVLDWRSGKATNLGFLLTATTIFGTPVNLKVARRNRHHNSKQPILVLFDDDGKRPSPPSSRTLLAPPPNYPIYYSKYNQLAMKNEIKAVDKSVRMRRSLDNMLESQGNHSQQSQGNQSLQSQVNASAECIREDLNVDFEEIGWSSWIITPKRYNAYQCKGYCNFPLGQNQRPTNHATVQSIVHQLRLHAGVTKPCCVPNALLSLTLLLIDDNDSVMLRQYDDMIAESCGCH